MRFRSIRVRGLGPFDTERAVAFDELEGKITAVTGANGAGKSTLLELLIGAIYRRCPTRGTLVDLATARDAFVEVDFAHGGHAYRIKQLIDGTARKSEAVITCDDRPAVESTKVSAVEAFVEKHFPEVDLLLVSTFAAQQSRGFLECKPGERKSLLLKMLGVDQLEELAAAARARALESRTEAEIIAARVTDELARAGDPVTLESAVDIGMTELAAARGAHEAAVAARDAGVEESARAEAELKVAKQRLVEADLLMSEWRVKERDLQTVSRKIEAALGITKRATAVREAAAQLTELVAEETVLEQRLAVMRETDLARARDRTAHGNAMSTSKANGDAAAAVLKEREAIEQAVAAQPELEKTLAALNADREAAEAEYEEWRGKQVLGDGARIIRLRVGLEKIALDECDEAKVAKETLDADNAAEALAAEVPKKIEEFAARVRSNRAQVSETRKEMERAMALGSKAPLIARAETDLTEARAAWSTARDALRSLEEAERAATNERASISRRRSEIAQQRRSVEALGGADMVDGLTRAEAQLGELRPQRETLVAEIESLNAKVKAAGEVKLPTVPDVTKLRSDVIEADRKLRAITAEVAEVEGRLARAREASGRVANLSQAKARHQLDERDWFTLATDLGKDGLQAAISDSALPELVTLTNSLLHAAFGPRFTVDLRSQVASASGKKMLETLDVVVIDTVGGREAEAETFSGGEVAIIGEGLSLALTTLACRASGVTAPTLIRDEAGAALDPENGRAWMAMLRRAVDMIGADRLLFVSHSPEVTALADSRIEL